MNDFVVTLGGKKGCLFSEQELDENSDLCRCERSEASRHNCLCEQDAKQSFKMIAELAPAKAGVATLLAKTNENPWQCIMFV
jgi:hypothetical protein